MGKKKLMESLPAGTTARAAETLKWSVIARLKRQIQEAAKEAGGDGLVQEAVELRRLREEERPEPMVDDKGEVFFEPEVPYLITMRAEQIEEQHGLGVAQSFADIAFGEATPLRAHLQQLFDRKKYSRGYEEDFERALNGLEEWCIKSRIAPTVEAITREVASRYVHQRFVVSKTHHKTANKDVSALSSYWRWLRKTTGVKENPWSEQRLEAPAARHGRRTDVKRPFTDDEVTQLLTKLPTKRERDFSMISALSGMREDEIAELRVSTCQDGWFDIKQSKTPAGVRKVPIHAQLMSLIEERCRGKQPQDYIFHELPEPDPKSKRGRGAAVAQAFTRQRRKVGVDERGPGQRQSNVDFHSWRRWFVSRAVNALHAGAQGYDPWTIAHVAGHKAEGGVIDGVALPLGMTMGRYRGMSPPEALRAAVSAVKLPLEEMQVARGVETDGTTCDDQSGAVDRA